MASITLGICESLFYTQKSKYNKLYYLQTLLTFLYTISLTLDEVFPWNQKIMQHIQMFFQVLSIPIFTLTSPAIYIFWAMTLLFIVTLYIAFAVLSSGLLNGDLDRKWLGPYVRISLGIVGTFWITILRTLFVLAACKDDKSILLEEHSCGGAGTGALAVSAVFIAAFWAMYGASWLTHEISPLSHNALARTSCKFDMIHSFWLAAIVTTGLVLRPYTHDGVYDLHVPYAVAGCMMVGGAHQWYYLSTNQPFFSKSMNDFKAACSAGVLWTGIMTLAISIMYKIMEKDHSGPGQGMADFTEEIRTAMTIAYLGLLLPAMALGWNRSKIARDNIVKRKLAEIQPLIDDMMVSNEAETDHEKKVKEGKLVNATHNPDDDKLWEAVHERFIPGLGITSSQSMASIETEIASRFLLKDLHAYGQNLRSLRYKHYKETASDLAKAQTMFQHNLNPLNTHEGCQSTDIMLQYIRFCMSYGLMPPLLASKKLDDLSERYSDELSFFSKLIKWRLARTAELATRRESSMEMESDGISLGFEEVKKKQRAAMEFHKLSISRSAAVWRFLEKYSGATNAHKKLYRMLERIWQAEQGATDAYLYVLDKATSDVETLHKFAVFQMMVKKDRKIATELKSVADSIGETSMQSSGSNNSNKGANRLEFLNEIRVNVTANSLISRVQLQMSLTTVAIIIVVTVLFIVYLLLIDQYKQNLISLTESGARSYYSMALALNVRDMHAYAIVDDRQQWNRASALLYANCRELSDRHVHLIHTHRTAYQEQVDFYKEPQEYINVKIPLAPSHLVSPGKAVRHTRLSGMDVAFRLIVAASEVQKSRPNDFLAFDPTDPASFSALWYVLENAHITAKAMDQSTIIYVYEATDIATMMAIVFIALSSVAVFIEAVLVIFIFRNNVEKLFSAMYNSEEGASAIVNQCNSKKEIVPLIIAKNSKKTARTDALDAENLQRTSSTSAKAKALEDDDSEEENQQQLTETAAATGVAEEDSDDSDDSHGESDQDMQQIFLKMFYYTCLTIITGCLCTLCALCYVTVSHAEASANDLNNGSRRRYIDGRVLYLTKELLYSVNEAQSLVGGTFTLLNSTDLIRCMLRRAGYALISSHYSLIYGGDLGFKSLGSLQNWLGGDVKSWLPPNWKGPLPDQQQEYGYESPPKWSETGGDYCTPFTWSHSHFEKGIDMKGSLGNSELQDSIYFTSNCFTDLELTESIVLEDERIKFFSDQMKPEQCYGFRSDIILCADMERQSQKYLPKPRVDRFFVEGCLTEEEVVSCSEKIAAGRQCDADEFGAYQDCEEAERRRKCDVARFGPYKEKKCLLPLEKGQSVPQPDPTCNPMVDFGNGRVAPRDGVQRDTELGISDLDFYNSEFKASFTHADIKPRDPIMTMGLHTLINFYMDNAISISNDPIENINPDSTFFHRIYKYANGEIQSGQEIAGGLFKSILIAQHDVLTEMDNNTSVTIVAFVVIMVVVMLQLAFLSSRIRSVVMSYFGITSIIVRLLGEIDECRAELEAREGEELGFKDKAQMSDDDGEEVTDEEVTDEDA